MTADKFSLPPKANLRVKEIAEFLDLSASVIYNMINEHAIPHVVVGGQKRIPRAEFLEWYRSKSSHGDGQ